ncbi:MAG: TetR/AcrR family transcriptional regulator [Actinobacteria bacterium]|nr:TetR/AcrR family transcriptional regulator [Actinomycetota bacterium]MBU1943606.1 TetR/AcrR family transcriptional regulator [Actinomycetota bacterium]MBU2688939.1 TetR/AcrR family transcriptional regulator [Actinomycetota bacterium]
MAASDKREEILRVAERVFATKGYKGAALKDIADEVGIKTPGLYNYFRSKEDIYRTLLSSRYVALREAILPRMAATPDPKERVELFVSLLIDFLAEHPGFPMVLAQEVIWSNDFALKELAPDFLVPFFNEMIDSLEESGIAEQGYSRLDTEMLVFNMFGLSTFYFFAATYFTVVTGEDSMSPASIARLKENILEMLFNGIGIS